MSFVNFIYLQLQNKAEPEYLKGCLFVHENLATKPPIGLKLIQEEFDLSLQFVLYEITKTIVVYDALFDKMLCKKILVPHCDNLKTFF